MNRNSNNEINTYSWKFLYKTIGNRKSIEK